LGDEQGSHKEYMDRQPCAFPSVRGRNIVIANNPTGNPS
jgi:hypothetical protein